MARRTVTCRSCGYSTTPVSGFCPRCLELLPVGPRIAAAPLLLGVFAALVLGAGLTAALSRMAPGTLSVQQSNVPGSTPAVPSAATAPSGSESATTPSPATQSAPAVAPSQPLRSPAVVPPAAGAASSPAPAAGAASSPAPTAAPTASGPPGTSPPPTAVLGAESLPSTATDGDVMR